MQNTLVVVVTALVVSACAATTPASVSEPVEPPPLVAAEVVVRGHAVRVAGLPSTGGPLFVLPDGGLPVVLGELEEPIGDEGLEIVGSRPHVRAGRTRVPFEEVPAPLRAWRQVELRLFGAAGEVCTASIVGFELHSRVVLPDPEDAGKTEYELGSGSSYLVGTLDPEADCDQALWALSADRPTPEISAFQIGANPPGGSEGALLSAFRTLPEYRQVAEGNRAEGVDSFDAEAWERHGGARPAFAHAASSPFGPLAFVGTTAGIGCGEFFGRLWAIFTLGDDGALRALATGRGDWAGYGLPRSVIAWPDGRREVLFESLTGVVLYRFVDGALVETRALRSHLAHGC